MPRPLDVAAMHAAAQQLIGKHDFTTFRSTECQAKSPVKTLDRLDVIRDGDEVSIVTTARSFLHNQVRSMVGSLVHVGDGKWSAADLAAALAARDRAACGQVAPAAGTLSGAGGLLIGRFCFCSPHERSDMRKQRKVVPGYRFAHPGYYYSTSWLDLSRPSTSSAPA